MTRAGRELLSVDLGPLKAQAEAHCLQRGQKVGRWVRGLVRDALVAAGVDAVQDEPATRPAASRRLGAEYFTFTARLSQQESQALLEGAAAAGVSQVEYLARLLMGDKAGRSRLDTLAALAQLSERLLGVSAQLAGMAHQLDGQLPAEDQAVLASAAREARAHARLTAEVAEGLRTTRRSAGRRGRRD